MFPIRDRNPSGHRPYASWLLIGLNLFVFLSYWPAGTEESVVSVYNTYGLVPARLSNGEAFHTIVTSLFIHGGWFHIGLNMLFLAIFSDNLEAEMGSFRFLAFYLVCGVIAALMQYISGALSSVPIAGASGAVAGVMGGYLLMFPRARVVMLLYLVVALRFVAVPAWLLLSLWFGLQVLGGLSTPSSSSSVAFWSHIGGFLTGVALTTRLWRHRGGVKFWRRFHGLPPHPAAKLSIPVVRRRGAILPPPQSRGLFRRID